MDFSPNEAQRMVQSTARAFSRDRLAPIAARIEREEAIPADVLGALARLGLMGVNVPESLGGCGGGRRRVRARADRGRARLRRRPR